MWDARYAIMNAGRQIWFDWDRNNNGVPKFDEERDPTPLGDKKRFIGEQTDMYYLLSMWDNLKKVKHERKRHIGDDLLGDIECIFVNWLFVAPATWKYVWLVTSLDQTDWRWHKNKNLQAIRLAQKYLEAIELT